jgi:hypothetical protein
MKTITCFDCDMQFSGETPQEVQLRMLPHYREVHPEIINSVDDAGRKAWMEEFDKRWKVVSENS